MGRSMTRRRPSLALACLSRSLPRHFGNRASLRSWTHQCAPTLSEVLPGSRLANVRRLLLSILLLLMHAAEGRHAPSSSVSLASVALSSYTKHDTCAEPGARDWTDTCTEQGVRKK